MIGRVFPNQKFGLPARYGMTVGELALLINNKWIENPAKLTIIGMKGYKRNENFDPLTWVLPSPNMPTLDTALVYPGMGIFEQTNLS